MRHGLEILKTHHRYSIWYNNCATYTTLYSNREKLTNILPITCIIMQSCFETHNHPETSLTCWSWKTVKQLGNRSFKSCCGLLLTCTICNRTIPTNWEPNTLPIRNADRSTNFCHNVGKVGRGCTVGGGEERHHITRKSYTQHNFTIAYVREAVFLETYQTARKIVIYSTNRVTLFLPKWNLELTEDKTHEKPSCHPTRQ